MKNLPVTIEQIIEITQISSNTIVGRYLSVNFKQLQKVGMYLQTFEVSKGTTVKFYKNSLEITTSNLYVDDYTAFVSEILNEVHKLISEAK